MSRILVAMGVGYMRSHVVVGLLDTASSAFTVGYLSYNGNQSLSSLRRWKISLETEKGNR